MFNQIIYFSNKLYYFRNYYIRYFIDLLSTLKNILGDNMKSKRYLYLVLILLALMISISAVSAADDSASELIGANDDNGFILGQSMEIQMRKLN